MRTRRILAGLGALLVLAAILAGLPALLVTVAGNPLPQALPSLEEARGALLSPDDGTLALTGAVLLGWLVWAALAVSILVEALWQLRGIRVPRLPGLALPQAAVRGLVTTALALLVAAPQGLDGAAAAREPVPQPAQTTQASAPATVEKAPESTTTTSQQQPDPAMAGAGTSTYVVQPGDTLWSIAATHLGSGHEYHRIVEANRRQLTHGADWVTPGLELTIPAPEGRTRQEGQVVVAEGDTLSGLAATHLGDGARWPQIYQASTSTVQTDGRRLSDPDLIYPGWHLTLPGADAPDHEEHAEQAPTYQANGGGDEISSREQVDQAKVEGGAATPADEAAAPDLAADAAATGAALGAPEPGAATRADADTPTGRPAAATLAATGHDTESQEVAAGQLDEPPSWLLEGVAGSGALLGGALFIALGLRRRARFRTRRPGRALAATEQALTPVEKTIQTYGATAAPTLEQLDEVLRRLGTRCRQTGASVPAVIAVQAAPAGVTLHLREASDLGQPWEGSTDQLHWLLPAEDLEQVGAHEQDAPAPFPLLVCIGAGDDGTAWLLNLEGQDVCLTGEPEYVEDLARFLAAEIAVNPWSAGVRVDCLGVAQEVIPMNPARLRDSTPEDLEETVGEVVGVIDRVGDTDVATARAAQSGEETWPARLVLLTAEAAGASAAGQLRQLLAEHGRRTGACVVVRGGTPGQDTMEVVATGGGRVLLPAAGLDLVGVGLTADEAAGCAALLAQSQTEDDVPMPAASLPGEDRTWRVWADQAGAIRPEHTTPRTTGVRARPGTSVTLLAEDDRSYVESAATTPEDLAALSPRVGIDVADRVKETDPTLDADLAAWWDPQVRVPRLSLLGPVKARTWGKPMADRKAYFTELLAYLALHPDGVTPAQTAEAFNLTEAKARDYVGRCRDWLGKDTEGHLHLPYAQDAPAARQRGVNVYQVSGLLLDVDLFRRLRARGTARGGPDGVSDLKEALRLVEGTPFDQLRRGGWGWLFEGDRIDQHMTCAIVDVAHLVATHDLQAGDLTGARAAAEVAALAAPHEEIPTLDLAAVTMREGRTAEATRLLVDEVCNRTDDPDAPPGDLSERTRRILDAHGWLEDRQEAV